MRDIFDEIDRFAGLGRRMAIARVVDTEGSGPRQPGAAMAVTDRGEVAGSVSGGCVEAAVVSASLGVLSGEPARMVSFGYSDDEAFAVGLTCGGIVHLFIEPLVGDLAGIYPHLVDAIRADRPIALATVVRGAQLAASVLVELDGTVLGEIPDEDLQRVVVRDALGELAAARTGVRHYGEHGEAGEEVVTVFVESFAPPPQMLIFGATDFTAALVRVAKVLGFRVTVCDARDVFATEQRFPQADHVVVDWPHRLLESVRERLGPRDVVCVLTHDHKFDVPALLEAVRTDVGYIGAMGSRSTHADRVARLIDAGAASDDLDRIRAPIGLDLGASTPEETAISICAEIIASRSGRGAGPLGDTDGPIH